MGVGRVLGGDGSSGTCRASDWVVMGVGGGRMNTGRRGCRGWVSGGVVIALAWRRRVSGWIWVGVVVILYRRVDGFCHDFAFGFYRWDGWFL